MSLTVLIVDTERSERTSLAELCTERGDVKIVGEAESGAAALRAADELCPDVMLLDLDIPDMSGFELINAARGQSDNLSVIVTGGQAHARAALAAGAFDFLVKPIDAVHLDRSLELAEYRIESLRANTATSRRLQLSGAFEMAPISHNRFQFLVGQRQQRFYPLELGKIDYIEAQGNYVTIRSGRNDYIRRDSIKRVAAFLGDRGFIQIERSLILNVSAVAYAEVARHGTFAFTLHSGACLQSSKSYRETILKVIPLAPLSMQKGRRRITHPSEQ
jgi:two-component system LytT family response regulator